MLFIVGSGMQNLHHESSEGARSPTSLAVLNIVQCHHTIILELARVSKSDKKYGVLVQHGTQQNYLLCVLPSIVPPLLCFVE
jgi:hypothetical protein